MVSQEIVAYIHAGRESGQSDLELREALVGVGWDTVSIDDAFGAVSPQAPEKSPEPIQPKTSSTPIESEVSPKPEGNVSTETQSGLRPSFPVASDIFQKSASDPGSPQSKGVVAQKKVDSHHIPSTIKSQPVREPVLQPKVDVAPKAVAHESSLTIEVEESHSKKTVLIIGAIVVILILLGGGAAAYYKFFNTKMEPLTVIGEAINNQLNLNSYTSTTKVDFDVAIFEKDAEGNLPSMPVGSGNLDLQVASRSITATDGGLDMDSAFTLGLTGSYSLFSITFDMVGALRIDDEVLYVKIDEITTLPISLPEGALGTWIRIDLDDLASALPKEIDVAEIKKQQSEADDQLETEVNIALEKLHNVIKTSTTELPSENGQYVYEMTFSQPDLKIIMETLLTAVTDTAVLDEETKIATTEELQREIDDLAEIFADLSIRMWVDKDEVLFSKYTIHMPFTDKENADIQGFVGEGALSIEQTFADFNEALEVTPPSDSIPLDSFIEGIFSGGFDPQMTMSEDLRDENSLTLDDFNADDKERMMDTSTLQLILELEFDEKGKYPISLSTVDSEYMPSKLTKSGAKKEYTYERLSDGDSYCIGTVLDNEKVESSEGNPVASLPRIRVLNATFFYKILTVTVVVF